MKRFRHLGIAAVAVLALTALVGVASANATGFAVKQYPATVTAEQTEALTFSNNGLIMSCWGTAVGSMENATAPSASLGVSPFSCTSNTGTTTLKAEGCQFTFAPGPLGGTGSLATSGCTMVLKNNGCTWEYKPQTVETKAFVQEGSPSRVNVPLNGYMHYTGGTCGLTEGNLGVTGSWVLRATNEAGTYIDLSLMNSDGVFFNSGKSLFEAETYPVHLRGEQTTANVIGVNGLTIQCGKVTFGANLSAAGSLLSTQPNYSECTSIIAGLKKSVEIRTSGCSFAFHSAGTADVACKPETKAIEIEIALTKTSTCRYKASPQTGLAGVGYSTEGSGSSRGIAIALNLKTLKLTNEIKSVVCGNNATETATYTGGTTLHADL